MVLSEETILRLVKEDNMIENFNRDHLQTASYDLTVDMIEDKYKDTILKAGEFRLISTKEIVNMPNDVAAFCKTKSSMARLGIVAGDVGCWIDPGFSGNITIAVFNLGRKDIDLSKIDSMAQIIFLEVDDYTDGYNGHYQNSNGLTESIFKNSIW